PQPPGTFQVDVQDYLGADVETEDPVLRIVKDLPDPFPFLIELVCIRREYDPDGNEDCKPCRGNRDQGRVGKTQYIDETDEGQADAKGDNDSTFGVKIDRKDDGENVEKWEHRKNSVCQGKDRGSNSPEIRRNDDEKADYLFTAAGHMRHSIFPAIIQLCHECTLVLVDDLIAYKYVES